MKRYSEMSRAELTAAYDHVKSEFEKCTALNLKLNMARGKPGSDQLDLSLDLLNMPITPAEYVSDGVEVRNYGTLEGLPSCRRLFAEILGVKPEQVFVGGNASLTMMHDTVSRAFTHGLLHSKAPWSQCGKVKFICPVPGYDRHFAICESFGIEMINVPMLTTGPDMDIVEALVKDESVKGMWCVPKFSNPTGIIYSNETIARIAALKPAASDFALLWDNAYYIHEFDGDFAPIPNIIEECAKHGNADMPYVFMSTSKVTFPGAGVACLACSEANMAHYVKFASAQSISYDKINQHRHVKFLKDMPNTLAHMKKQAAILKPKFEAVLNALEKEIAPLGIAEWNRPKGGYFVSVNVMPGCAKRTQQLCAKAGVVLTSAGATFPYSKDPADSNLRIAPSYPPENELKLAIEVFCTCLKLAALERLGADK